MASSIEFDSMNRDTPSGDFPPSNTDAQIQQAAGDVFSELRQKVQDPKTTFWSMIQNYNTQNLRDQGIIDQTHFTLLQDLKQRAEAYKDIYFPHQRRHVLTLFANQPQAFKAIIALDREYKSRVAGKPLDTPPVVNLNTPVHPTNAKLPTYIEARVKRAVCYAFAALATTGVVYFGLFKISLGLSVLPLVVTIASLYFASKVIDYRDPETQKTLREEFNHSEFVRLYRRHGLVNLLQVFSVDELKQKFNAEIRDPKTTFWNVLRRYNLQELHQAGILSSEHLTLLTNLRTNALPLNLVVCTKTGWLPSFTYHVHTAFANEPEAYRMVEALDRAYKSQVETTL